MRVIAGVAKGRRLAAPKSKIIRPVLDQVKEAIFNILFDVSGFSVLDLFAGTGAMGIEALSRGAAYCCFVDISKEALRLIGKNLDNCQMAGKAYVLGMTIGKALGLLEMQQKRFDLVFVDPPYEKHLVNKTLRRLASSPALASGAIIIVEHHPKEPIFRGSRPPRRRRRVEAGRPLQRQSRWSLPLSHPSGTSKTDVEIPGLRLTDQRKYGQTLVSFLKHESFKQ